MSTANINYNVNEINNILKSVRAIIGGYSGSTINYLDDDTITEYTAYRKDTYPYLSLLNNDYTNINNVVTKIKDCTTNLTNISNNLTIDDIDKMKKVDTIIDSSSGLSSTEKTNILNNIGVNNSTIQIQIGTNESNIIEFNTNDAENKKFTIDAGLVDTTDNINSSSGLPITSKGIYEHLYAKLNLDGILKCDGNGAWSTAKGGTDYQLPLSSTNQISSAMIESNAVSKIYTTTIPVSNWSVSGDYYTQTISVDGILITDDPVIDLQGTSITEDTLYDWGQILYITTSNNSITIMSASIPTTAIPIKLLCIRK